MNMEKVGVLTENEKNEILGLFQRRAALNELMLTLRNQPMSENHNDALYEKLVNDLGKTMHSYDNWFGKASKLYNWKSSDNGHWSINFETNEVFLCKRQ
jgi:CXXX repeat modification system protein